MSAAKRYIYNHLDMEDLEKKLESVKDVANIKMIVTDGVFSMDGEYCPLPKIKELAQKVAQKKITIIENTEKYITI